ncbi:MAG: FAD-dependent oxidoreductase [Rhodanobacter sp.]
MSDATPELDGPDFAAGIPLAQLADGALLQGHAQGVPILLVRRGDEVFAVDAICTHYGAPLADGLLVGDTVRCPWHHACFSLRTGALLRAPALQGLSCWQVEQRDGMIYVGDKRSEAERMAAPAGAPTNIVIVGGGAAGNSAAETLRNEGYTGAITMLSADASLPCDRPTLSKGFLAGTVDEAYNLLRSEEFYREQRIDLKLNTRVTAIDVDKHQLQLADGGTQSYDALLLATGAAPIHLNLPGGDLPHVHYLRTLKDGEALTAAAKSAKRAVVIGASFIGLEVASSLRTRGIEVDVIGRETVLMEKVLGAEVGAFLKELHEKHGVTFHLGTSVSKIEADSVTLEDGSVLAADLVVIGIGVRPAIELAEQAGLSMNRGVNVDEYLQTSVPGIYAAGDIARWPDKLGGEAIRVEHWVVAGRQGQTAARNLLGKRERFDAVPFFWSEQYDFAIAYVGHAEQWDKAVLDGSLADFDCRISYQRDGKELATAVVRRDLEGLRSEVEFERTVAARK